jgi:hypothetical protein
MMQSGTRWGLVAMTLASMQAGAIELEDGKLSISSFCSWGFGTSDLNDFQTAGHGGHFDSGECGVGLSSPISDRAIAAVQMRFAPENGGLFLDWAFGEWRFSDRARLRMGLVKHPLGIFGEVQHVGTLRPFFLFPFGIYGGTEFTGSGVAGASLSGRLPAKGGWDFNYDLYFGSLKLRVDSVIEKVVDPASVTPGGTLPVEVEETTYVGGGRLIVATPVPGLEARLSGYGSPIRQTDGPRFAAGPSLQYLGDRFSARAEYFFFWEEQNQRTHTAYVEAAYFLTPHFQVGARAELYRLHLLKAPADSPLFEHYELATTFNYWFDTDLVVKLSFHAIDGNRFARPRALDDALLSGRLNRRTLASILGMQFSF